MIYQRALIKELTYTAIAIFTILMVILMATQAINMLGRAADGRIAWEAAGVILGAWVIRLLPLILILTAYISILATLTRYWRDSEMTVWLTGGLPLQRWIYPVWQFTLPLMLVVAAVSFWAAPISQNQALAYAHNIKQKQIFSLIRPGQFVSWQDGAYFIESFDSNKHTFSGLWLKRPIHQQAKDEIIMVKSGEFTQKKDHILIKFNQGSRYLGNHNQRDYTTLTFNQVQLTLPNNNEQIDKDKRRISTLGNQELWQDPRPQARAEWMWRLSLPMTLPILALLAIALAYDNPRANRSFQSLAALTVFFIYYGALTFAHAQVSAEKISWPVAFVLTHGLLLLLALFLMRYRLGFPQQRKQRRRHSS